MTEQEIRRRLIKSHATLFQANHYPYSRIMQIVKATFNDFKTAYCIKCVPEQGEDIFTLLVDTYDIIEMEISHDCSVEAQVLEISSVKKYMIGKSKADQIRLEVALDLAKKGGQS